MLYKIRVGDKVTIREFAKEKRRKSEADIPKDAAHEYISQVEDVLSVSEIVVSVPIVNGKIIRLSEVKKYKMLFYTSQGMVEHEARILSYFREGEMYMMSVKLVDKGVSAHKRSFFRLDCALKLKYNIIISDVDEHEANPDAALQGVTYDGLIRDISGGGMRFWANRILKGGQKIECKILLGNDLLIVVGTVLNIQSRTKMAELKNSDFKYEYFVNYSGITEQDQGRLIKFIFTEQRNILKAIR